MALADESSMLQYYAVLLGLCIQIKAVVKRLTETKPTVLTLKSKPVFKLAQDKAEILLKIVKTWVKLIMTNIKLIKIIIVQSHFQR